MMMNPIAAAVLTRLSMTPIAVAPHMQAAVAGDLTSLAQADPEKMAAQFELIKENLCAAYGLGKAEADKPFAYSNGVAIIPIHGTLINRFGGSWGFVTGYNFIRSQTLAAKEDPDVKAVIYDVNSNGGEVAGCQETAEVIASLRGVKPSMAYADSRAYSAAYWTGSAAEKLVVTPSGGVGSIGAMCMHVDVSQALESFGVKVTLLHAGEHKVDGNPFEPLNDDTKEAMQSSLDAARADFAQSVATNRGLSLETVMGTEARCYDAKEAQDLGLVDGIAHPSQAVSQLLGGGDAGGQQANVTTKEESTMDQKEIDALKTASHSEGAAAERARVQGIMTCEEAKGRSTLANHIAFNTTMSVEEAKGMLAVSALEVNPTAQAPQTPFSKAMDKDNPNIPANEGQDKAELSAEETTAAEVAAILGARQMATGKAAK